MAIKIVEVAQEKFALDDLDQRTKDLLPEHGSVVQAEFDCKHSKDFAVAFSDAVHDCAQNDATLVRTIDEVYPTRQFLAVVKDHEVAEKIRQVVETAEGFSHAQVRHFAKMAVTF